MKKNPLQNSILRILANKKAISADTLKDEAKCLVEGGYSSKTKPEYAISRSIRNLIEGGLAEVLPSGQGEYLRITPTGRQKLRSIELSSGTMPVPAVWDGLWRIMILDLPESRKNEREALRYLLKKAGFICMKNTVWVSPYPFEHFFGNIKKDLGLTTEMMIMTTDTIDEETEKMYRKAFDR